MHRGECVVKSCGQITVLAMLLGALSVGCQSSASSDSPSATVAQPVGSRPFTPTDKTKPAVIGSITDEDGHHTSASFCTAQHITDDSNGAAALWIPDGVSAGECNAPPLILTAPKQSPPA